MAAGPVFIGAAKAAAQVVVNADGTNWKDLLVPGANGSKVVSILATTNESAERLLQISLLRGGVNYWLASVLVPPNAGLDGDTPTVDVLNALALPGLPIDQDGQRYFFLESGDKIQVGVGGAAVTATKTIWITAFFGNI